MFRKFPALIVSLLLISIAVYIFLNNIVYKSIPSSYEEKSFSSVNDTIEVYKNQYGIPHIIAKNETDAFFMAGYCHAEDRLWQMDIMRIVGKGNLSTCFGRKTLMLDIFMRSLDLHKIANDIWNNLSKSSRTILESYSNGINAYIDSHRKNLPFEFGTLGYLPAKWEPTDCILIQRLFALELSPSFWSDIVFGEISERLGTQKTLDLFPSYPQNVPYVLDSMEKGGKSKKSEKLMTQSGKNIGREGFEIFHSISEITKSISDYLGNTSCYSGSNAWVIKKNKLANSTTAVLANDPHFSLGLPSKFYQMHLTCPSINVTGMTIPGFPLFLIGRNDNISWGFTNMMADDADYFIEKIDNVNNDFYFNSSGTKTKFKFVSDTIKIKNEEPYVYYKRYTKRSAVISDFSHFSAYKIFPETSDSSYSQKFSKRYCLTYSWIGKEKSDEINALYNISKSKNWEQFLHGTHLWHTPGLVFVFGDKFGNIGAVPAAALPLRKKNCKPQIPNPGWLEDYDWQGITTLSNLPVIYNPQRKYVLSANNKMVHSSEPYISSLWEPSSRAERIDELLNQFINYTSREAQIMQMDIQSPYSKQLLSLTIPILDKYSGYLNNMDKQALNKLKKWDYQMSSNMASPAIVNAFIERLVYNTFADEMGDRLYNEFIQISSIPQRRIIELLADSTSSVWFDNIKTQRYELKENIVIESFKDAIQNLIKLYNNEDINSWKYSKIHTLKLNHILSSDNLLKPTLSLGPFEVAGNNSTIQNTEWNFLSPFDVKLGASVRFIADMSEDFIYTSLPGGASGDPFSDNWSNQIQLWLNGGYVSLPVGKNPGINFKKAILILPEK
ncbi:MAG: penicillin acylase family protein [FCB group bacterium]